MDAGDMPTRGTAADDVDDEKSVSRPRSASNISVTSSGAPLCFSSSPTLLLLLLVVVVLLSSTNRKYLTPAAYAGFSLAERRNKVQRSEACVRLRLVAMCAVEMRLSACAVSDKLMIARYKV